MANEPDEFQDITDPEARAKDRGAFFGFVGAEGKSLGNPDVVDALLREYAGKLVELRKRWNLGEIDLEEVKRQTDALAGKVQDVFFGREAGYVALPAWNTPEKLGAHLVEAIPLDRTNEEGVRGAMIQFAVDIYNALGRAEEGRPEGEWQFIIDGAMETYSSLLLGLPVEL